MRERKISTPDLSNYSVSFKGGGWGLRSTGEVQSQGAQTHQMTET